MLIGMISTAAMNPGTFCQKIYPVGTTPQGDLAQSSQIFRNAFCLLSLTDTFPCHSFQQLFRLYIHQFHLIRLVEDGIRDTFFHHCSGDGSNHVIQTLNMLDIDRCININTGI